MGSLTAQSPEVGLKPEHCAVLPCAEDGLSMLICAFLAGRTHLQMRAMSLRVALLQPSHSSRAPALVVRFKVIQYQTHRKQQSEGHSSQPANDGGTYPQTPQFSTHACR